VSFDVITRERGVISVLRGLRDNCFQRRGVLSAPLSRGMTTVYD